RERSSPSLGGSCTGAHDGEGIHATVIALSVYVIVGVAGGAGGGTRGTIGRFDEGPRFPSVLIPTATKKHHATSCGGPGEGAACSTGVSAGFRVLSFGSSTGTHAACVNGSSR